MSSSPRFYIGNQTAFSAPPLVPFAYATQHGFAAFEFFPDGKPLGAGWTAADLPPETRATIRSDASDRGIRLSVHASLDANPVTTQGLGLLARDMKLARDIGARVVVIHLTPCDLTVFAKGVLSLIDDFHAADMLLAIENTIPTAPEDFNILFGRLQKSDATGARSVGMCLDIGHANLHASTHNDYLAYLDRLSPTVPIVHMHAHENRGDRDSHMPLFTGRAGEDPSGIEGVVRRLCQRDFAGSIILEQWPDPPSLLLIARERMQAMFMNTVCGEERRSCGIGA